MYSRIRYVREVYKTHHCRIIERVPHHGVADFVIRYTGPEGKRYKWIEQYFIDAHRICKFLEAAYQDRSCGLLMI